MGLAIGLLATPFAMFFWMISAGAGHGDYLLACGIYPIPMVPLVFAEGLFPISLTLAAIQFPMSGAFIGWAYSRGKSHLWACITLIVAIQMVGTVTLSQSSAFGR